MSHEKGIEAAIKAYEDAYEAPGEFTEADGVNVIIKAYLDASGMVMVPKEMTKSMVDHVYNVGEMTYEYDNVGEEFILDAYKAALDSVPNPFQTPEESREKK